MGGPVGERVVGLEARCAWCGPVALRPEQLLLYRRTGRPGLFEFRCPACERVNLRSIDDDELQLLRSVGIGPGKGRAPFELLEPRSGPPIGWDDVIDFHEALAGGRRPAAAPGRADVDREAA